MKALRNATASMTTLASLGALYGVVVMLTVLLSNRLLVNPLEIDRSLVWVFGALAVIFPTGLLAVVGLNVARLVRDRSARKPGSSLKARLTTFFAAVVIFAAVPQGVVSVSFLSSALQLLFNSGTGDAVRGGLSLIFDYYDRQIYDLRVFGLDGSMQRIVADRWSEIAVDASGGEIWPEIRQRVPLAATFQLFDADGSEVAFRGDRRFRSAAPPARVRLGDVGPVARASVAGEGILRLVVGVRSGGEGAETMVALLTVRLPPGFEARARGLTQAQEIFSRLEGLRSTFVLIVAILYGVFASPILLLAILAGFFLSDRIMRPIESLEEATRRVADGDYSVRILARPGDDLGLLVISFNRMVTELDRTRRRIAQAEKVQAWQEIAQRLAHEVKNPLTPIRLAAERLKRRYEVGSPDFGEVLDRTVSMIVREVEELTSLLNEFRSFSRRPEPRFEDVDLRALLYEVAAMYREDPRVTLDLTGVADEMRVKADRGQLRQAFVNLYANAVEASADAVRIAVSAREAERAGARICRVRVEDDGPGIPEDLQGDIFEPYVTSKPHGTGLGLAIVERIVFDHDGRISYESAPGSGTTFVLDLPVEQFHEGSGEV